ncbi:MAG: helix-turn-helix transcriptional regulator [Lachnospiraceae bacterium]|nr:helix-turn-helix transcriptional regulator [Lachnospiraceae bacterium]
MLPVVDTQRTGERIKELRKSKGLSVVDLAECVGSISVQSVYKWQTGENFPSIDNLVILRELFGVGIDEIIVIREV